MVAARDLLACAKNLFVSAMRSVERARKRTLRITTFKVEHGSNLVSPPGRAIDEFGDIDGAMRFAYCALRTANL
jgi:hypothetical protein